VGGRETANSFTRDLRHAAKAGGFIEKETTEEKTTTENEQNGIFMIFNGFLLFFPR
jgi:hypothetical protein